MTMTSEQITINGISIQHDKSGVGHCWVAADSDNCPPNIAEEIAAEIIDGKVEDTEDYVASNGLHYRW